MFFASAAFLAGLALLTVPWWLHRLNAHAAEQRTFSSLFLMRPSEAPVNLRRQLQHLVLLALRWLLLIAACLAFAEPIIRIAGTPGAAVEPEAHRLIVLDTSLSMSARADGESVFDAAQVAAREIIGDLPSGTMAALVTVSDRLELVVPLTDDRARLTGAVAGLEPGAARLAFDGLMGQLTTLGETLAAPGERLELHVISDFQASGLPDQFNALIEGAVWPLILHPVAPDIRAGNLAITSVRTADSRAATEGSTFELTVRSFGAPAGDVEIALNRNEVSLGRQTLPVPENGTATASFTLPAPVEAIRRSEPVSWTAILDTEDALAADNVRRFVEADAESVPLPVLAASDRAWAYFRAAVEAAAPHFVPERVTSLDDSEVPVVAVLDPGSLAGGTYRALSRYLESGGAVLMTAGVDTRAAGRIPLLDLPIAADRFEQSSRGVTALDRSHPALAGFASWQDLAFFQAIQGTSAAEAQASGEVILALDDGTPLLTEYRLGAGRLMLLGTALDPAWSTLVVRPAFVSFTANLLGYLAEDLLPAEALVGQPFAIPAQSVQLFDGAGERVLGLADTVGRPTVSLAAPGIYQLRTPSSTRLLAVNVDLAESDLAPAPAELLARWQASSVRVAESRSNATPMAADVASATWELALAPWLLALLALLVLIEPLFANLGSDRRQSRAAALAEART